MISGVITVKIFFWYKRGHSVWPNSVWRMSQQTWERIIYSLISLIAVLIIGFYIVPWIFNGTFHPAPSDNWKEKIKKADAALIFGFGYGTDDRGKMIPEASNDFLYNLVKQQYTGRYLIVQEGVFLSAIRDSSKNMRNKYIRIRMHPHDPNKDVNTFKAASIAIGKMDSLNLKSAIVYAHSMQLKRAVADLRKIASRNTEWKDFEFIVPDISETPFPKKSAQGRTRGKVLYRAVELYVSRVRDTWCY